MPAAGAAAPAVTRTAGYTRRMAPPVTAVTSQEALDAILSDTLPRQGRWSDEEYLWLTDRTRRLIEFTEMSFKRCATARTTEIVEVCDLCGQERHTRYSWAGPFYGRKLRVLRIRI